jgi:hypothetical protein
MSVLDSIKSVRVTNVDNYDQGPSRIGWRNGDRKARTPGKFYTSANQYTTEPTDPWQSSDMYTDEEGYETSLLRVAIIGVRAQWFRMDGDTRIWLQGYEQGARKFTEILCFAEGIDEPVVWSAKGLTGMAITNKGGIIPTYSNGLLREAKRLAGRKDLPLWSFWLPIATKIDNRGQVVYESTGYGNNVVTPPALHLPHDDHATNIEVLYVGNELVKWGDELRAEYGTWLTMQRGNTSHQTEEQNETASASADTDNEGDLEF